MICKDCGNTTCFENRKLGVSCAHCWTIIEPTTPQTEAEGVHICKETHFAKEVLKLQSELSKANERWEKLKEIIKLPPSKLYEKLHDLLEKQ